MTESVSAIILAGGRGRRFGDRDKGWIEWRGKPFIHHVIERLRPQTDQLIVSCNRNLAAYRALGLPCVTDQISGYAGPLAGVAAGLPCATGDLMLTVPCDAPLVPTDLAARLQASLLASEAELCYVWDGERDQYLFTLMKTSLKASIDRYLDAGRHSVRGWLATVNVQRVDFSDARSAFANINTPQELEKLSGISP